MLCAKLTQFILDEKGLVEISFQPPRSLYLYPNYVEMALGTMKEGKISVACAHTHRRMWSWCDNTSHNYYRSRITPREFRNLSGFRSVNLTGIFILFGTNLSDNYQRNAFNGSSSSVQLLLLLLLFLWKEYWIKNIFFFINRKLYIYILNNDNLIIKNNFKRSIH